jgi:hypothetical protein
VGTPPDKSVRQHIWTAGRTNQPVAQMYYKQNLPKLQQMLKMLIVVVGGGSSNVVIVKRIFIHSISFIKFFFGFAPANLWTVTVKQVY